MNKFLVSTALVLSLSACGTIISGSHDDVDITSVPSGAECVGYQDGRMLGRVTTPGTLTVPRSGADLRIECGRAGDLGSEVAEAGFNGWTLGNFAFGPLWIIGGLIIDMSTGAEHGYDDVNVKLAPTGLAEKGN